MLQHYFIITDVLNQCFLPAFLSSANSSAIPAEMTAMPAEICRSLTGCFMSSQATEGDALGYVLKALRACFMPSEATEAREVYHKILDYHPPTKPKNYGNTHFSFPPKLCA